MERLTDKGWHYDTACAKIVCISECDGCVMNKVLNRLAAYEDTGLEPENVENFKGVFNETAMLQLAAQYLNTMPDRLAELAQAEKDGRLVALP